jgi:hypothetical protein
MKKIATLAALLAALVSYAGGEAPAEKPDNVRTLGELVGVDLTKPWPKPGDETFKMPTPIGPFASGYVYTNTTGMVHQINLGVNCAAGTSTNGAVMVIGYAESDLVKHFPGMWFRPRLGRPEYLYGRYADIPDGKGWGVALQVAPPDDKDQLRLMMTFWNPSIKAQDK